MGFPTSSSLFRNKILNYPTPWPNSSSWFRATPAKFAAKPTSGNYKLLTLVQICSSAVIPSMSTKIRRPAVKTRLKIQPYSVQIRCSTSKTNIVILLDFSQPQTSDSTGGKPFMFVPELVGDPPDYRP